jgi:hypothetical protein
MFDSGILAVRPGVSGASQGRRSPTNMGSAFYEFAFKAVRSGEASLCNGGSTKPPRETPTLAGILISRREIGIPAKARSS